MTPKEFYRLLRIFADRQEDLDTSRNEVIVQVQNQTISLKTELVDGRLLVEEGGIVSSCEQFVADRLANLPFLARRILEFTEVPKFFVSPEGQYVDRIESDPNDTDRTVPDVLAALKDLVKQGTSFSSFVIYLTAEAGEGKTTLINELARHQAQAYIDRKSTRLVVPIELGGRSFLRLDDLIIGSVANHYKYRGLYIESFLELVKYGFIVPAFDGFEEMFVVGSSGEAVSSLGNLLANLSSEGQLIVSARTAYFEIRNFETQARLFDGLRDSEASFARLKVQKWGREQFFDYWRKRNLKDAEISYGFLTAKLGPDHPLLTRAVLVKRLVDIAEDAGQFERLLGRLDSTSSYFAELVDSILEREIEGKWVDRAEDAANRPLLSLSEHHELLSMLAVEMAISSSGQLGKDEVSLVTELFCDLKKLPPPIARQVANRIFDHPLLAKVDSTSNSIRFDHDEFREFFLGEAIGAMIVNRDSVEFQDVARKVSFSVAVIDSCLKSVMDRSTVSLDDFNFVRNSVSHEGPASFAKENGTKILLRFLSMGDLGSVAIENSYITPDSFIGRTISNVEFRKCIFLDAVFEASTLTGCQFSDCEIECVSFRENARFIDTSFRDCEIRCVTTPGDESPVFNPLQINAEFASRGIDRVSSHQDVSSHEMSESVDIRDTRFDLMIRGLRPFYRSTGINESTLRLRLGKRSTEFEEEVLPVLVDKGILVSEPYRGAGSDRRFRLGVRMSDIQDALNRSLGSFDMFLREIRNEE